MQTARDEQGRVAIRELGSKRSAQRAIWLPALWLLDAFVLGGITSLVLVEWLLNDTMSRMNQAIPGDAFGVIPHVQDKLLLYWVGFIGVAVVLAVATLSAHLWTTFRSRER